METQNLKQVLIDEDDSSITADSEILYCCSIGDVVKLLEEQRSDNDARELFDKIRNCNCLFHEKIKNGQIQIADLDEAGLTCGLFEERPIDLEIAFWNLGIERNRTPFENLSLMSLRVWDSKWQTNFVEQFLSV